MNPLRYRGYVYDVETKLYYLQSRYYNPQWGRFISADDIEMLLEDNENLLQYNLFAYCWNNPVNTYDPDGYWTLAIAKPVYIAVRTFGAANIWNPVGCVLLGIFLVGAVVKAGKLLYNNYKAHQNAATAAAQALLNYASTAATPPPPNKGGRGTQTTSKTLYKKSGRNGFRIDVENPGNRQGQIHLQKGNVKYYYNIAQQEFRIGSSNGKLAPAAIQRLLQDQNVVKAIAKGLQVLGY